MYDRARPNSRDFTNITISVDRNPNACKFTTLNYNATFLETELSGASVFTAQAADADLRVLIIYFCLRIICVCQLEFIDIPKPVSRKK